MAESLREEIITLLKTKSRYISELNSRFVSADLVIEILTKHPDAPPKWCAVKDGWFSDGLGTGKVLSHSVYVVQEWTPVLWENHEDPDFFKTAGLVFFDTEKQAKRYIKTLGRFHE